MCDVNHDQPELATLETTMWRTVIREFLLALQRGDLNDLLEAGRDKDEKKVKIFSPTEHQKEREHYEKRHEEFKRERSCHIHKSVDPEADTEWQSFNTGEKMS